MGYYQGGDNCYGRGDYYRGDYYRGDFLGIGKFLGKAAKTVVGVAAAIGVPGAGVAKRIIGGLGTGVIGGLAVEGARSIISPRGPYEQGPVGTMLRNDFIPGCQLKGTRPNKSGYYKQVVKGNPEQVVYIPPKSVCVKTRRLNVANPRALRRSIRRAQGFSKLARRVMTFVSAKAPRGRAKFKKAR